ncbi:Hypothetical protein CINCED_3A013094 [Cinara cedri]|uniref:Uncharacterized protein n=1 Tax=Cinara cedri TaxID=506608 RepID=A0A5E4N7M5_9HEMI|nr:Hypothetical protein CINCED_3A013094 [Cinara cedri]
MSPMSSILDRAIRNLLVLAVIGISYAHFKSVSQQHTKICTTEDCLRSATAFVESMNRSVNPCEDFYQFACGRYGNKHRIPKTFVSNDPFAETNDKMITFIRDYMEKNDDDNDPYALVQSRQLYRSCMATDEIDAAGLKPMINILTEIGLPHLGIPIKHSKKNSLSSILAKVKKYLNLDYLFSTTIDPDTKNRTLNNISLSKPRNINIFPVHKMTDRIVKMSSRKMRETLASEETIDSETENEDSERIQYIESYGKYFNGIWMEIYKHEFNNTQMPKSTLIHELGAKLKELLVFDNKLMTIKDEVYETDQELPTIMTVEKLQKFTDDITQNFSKVNEPTIDWKEYFTILFKDVDNVSLDFDTDFIHISNIEYFDALFKLLINSSETQNLLNIWWEVVVTLIPYTNNQLRFVQDRFYFDTTGLESSPRSVYCANAVNSMMGMAVARALVDIESVKTNTNMATNMLLNIHWAFEEIVKELNWMDDTTKKLTLYKANQMKMFVGYPEFIKNGSELNAYYSDFKVVENDYFGNVIRFVQRDLNNTLVLLREYNDYSINSWSTNPLEVNAYNWIQANAITIPAGILQFPFFGHDLQVLNYGFLGSILGHELTHGFDNTGRKFDHDGNENMWWTNKTISEYEKRSQCFIDHYESYLLPGIDDKINGKLTLDENIADNGGIREAFMAYKKFVTNHGEESKLPGLEEFTNEQIYFLAFANNWCEASTLMSLSQSLLDEHSPNYVRVIAGLTNSEEFSQVWNCPKGTRMNPTTEKCKIW